MQEIEHYDEAKQHRQNIFAEIQYPFHLVLKKVYFKDCLCGTYGDCKIYQEYTDRTRVDK